MKINNTKPTPRRRKPKKIEDKPMDAEQSAFFAGILDFVQRRYLRGDDMGALLGQLVEEQGCYLERATGPGLVCYTLQKPSVTGSVVVSTVGSKRLLVSAHGDDKHDILRERHFIVPVRSE